MKKLIIFGNGPTAELAHYFFTADSPYETIVFTVDDVYLRDNFFCGLPVIPFSRIVSEYPPQEYVFFIAVGYHQINALKKSVYLRAKNLGYKLVSYVSSKAIIQTNNQLGENVFIMDNCIVQPFSRIGNNVTLWANAFVGHQATVGDHCFFASFAVIGGYSVIGDECFLGIQALVRDRTIVGNRCLIGAGAKVLVDKVKENSVVAVKGDLPLPFTSTEFLEMGGEI